MPAYDFPVFKKLTKTDIGKKPGEKRGSNEGGPVIPRSLVPYFPPLPEPQASATADWPLILELFDSETPKGVITARWHYQTRGTTRAPEYRITRGIKPLLLADANVGDFLTFERDISAVDRFRVTLVRQGTEKHESLQAAVGSSAAGPVGAPPQSLTAIEDQMADIAALGQKAFSLEEPRRFTSEQRLFRDAAFSRLVKQAYAYSCAVCGLSLVAKRQGARPANVEQYEFEPEAAHIVPVAMNGPDDLRNGICLCRTHHWAFDRYLLFLEQDGCSFVWQAHRSCELEPRNAALLAFHRKPLRGPSAGPPPHPDAVRWHRDKALAI